MNECIFNRFKIVHVIFFHNIIEKKVMFIIRSWLSMVPLKAPALKPCARSCTSLKCHAKYLDIFYIPCDCWGLFDDRNTETKHILTSNKSSLATMRSFSMSNLLVLLLHAIGHSRDTSHSPLGRLKPDNGSNMLQHLV